MLFIVVFYQELLIIGIQKRALTLVRCFSRAMVERALVQNSFRLLRKSTKVVTPLGVKRLRLELCGHSLVVGIIVLLQDV